MENILLATSLRIGVILVAGDVLLNSATLGEPNTTFLFANAVGEWADSGTTDFVRDDRQLLRPLRDGEGRLDGVLTKGASAGPEESGRTDSLLLRLGD